VTDWDVWKEEPVQFKKLIKTMQENLDKIKILLKAGIPKIKEKRDCFCKETLKNAEI
jgi:5'-methylthioadenosine phosphorylase